MHAAAGLVRLLVDAGLLPLSDVRAAGATVVDLSMSHRVYRVGVGGEPRLVVKMADPIRSAGRDLRAEAHVYRLAHTDRSLGDVAPRCRAILNHGETLVLDPVDGLPLSATPLVHGSWAGTAGALRAYGQAVGRLHSARPTAFGSPPWLLTALAMPREASYALPEPYRGVMRGVAADPVAHEGARRAAASWHATALVHGDLRWSNALLEHEGTTARVRLVDWESACVGDPAWDVGSVLADILVAAVAGGARDLAGSIVAARPFLRGYRGRADLTEDAWKALLMRCLPMAGVRLIQAALEYSFGPLAEQADLGRLLATQARIPLTGDARLVGRLLAAAGE